ncbi:hypothetical protein [Erythrobacter aureus]|uniref:Heme exporter protein D n=1 Tax=Erythrobacter aureus TaxID=2182384 RepID=A0A345YIY2_9SPHN|nr:hypothetical protein [Erythrobacter aureus]AXK43884.1 hypothetical protein DVR09_15630 [Erythrobacter aureus]
MENPASIPSIVMIFIVSTIVLGWLVYEAQILLAARRKFRDLANSESRKRDDRIARQRCRLNTVAPPPMVRRAV